MNKHGFCITLEDIEAHTKRDEERKTRNSKRRKEGTTFGSELNNGAMAFDAIHGEEFYEKAIGKNGQS